MIELERKFLAVDIPQRYFNNESVTIIDRYVPKSLDHPKIRIRAKGNDYKITKKELVSKDDRTVFTENTIVISETEYNCFLALDSKEIRKTRYFFTENKINGCVDLFTHNLEGLIIVEFEFNNVSDKKNFIIPSYCILEISDKETFAGGVLAGKSYSDVEPSIKKAINVHI